MSFLAPLWLAAAGVVAAGLIVAHLFQRTVPPQNVFPTVRFVPESAPLTVLRSRHLTNVPLLLLRLAAIALLGLALAGAHLARRAPGQVVIVDVSRAVGSIEAAIDSALAAERGAVFIVADSAARQTGRDSLRALTRSSARGSLSAALVAAHRSIADRAIGHASSELVIVSPLARETFDSATARLVELWEGPVRVARVAATPQPTAGSWEVRTSGDDPVVAALGPPTEGRVTTRVVRDAPTAQDSLWAHNGGALVVWPRDGSGRVLAQRPVADSQGAVATARDVVVSTFARTMQPNPSQPLVRWADGEPAATERSVGSGCIRDVGIPVDPVGDMVLGGGFRAIAHSLVEPCGGAPDYAAVALSDRPAQRAAPPRTPADPGTGRLPLWFALGAATLLVIEQRVRRREPARVVV